MAHVDALSRHVGTVVQGGTLERKVSCVNRLKTRFVSNKAQVPTLAERKFFGTTMVFCIDVGGKGNLR